MTGPTRGRGADRASADERPASDLQRPASQSAMADDAS